jgi:hypothetical protein
LSKSSRIVCGALALSALFSSPAPAQQYTKAEAGIGTDSQTFTGTGGYHVLTTGVSGLAAYNFSRSVAIEGSLSFLPVFRDSPWQDSGRELTAFGGLKAGWRGRRFGLYGKIEPGLASFSCGLSYFGPEGQRYYNCERRTHFALQYGGVAEYKITPRTAARVDFAQTLISEFDQVLNRQMYSEEIVEGHLAQHFDLHFSVVHSFGAPRDPEIEPVTTRSTFDGGVLLALQLKEHLLMSNVEPDRGIGAWVSWNFSRYVSWDTSAFDFPQDDHTASIVDGGTSLDAFSGVKAGFRHDKFGVFGKVRPGAVVFSRTEDSISVTSTSAVISDSKLPSFALDTGGIVELYPSPRFIVRAEAGNVSIFYPAKTTYGQGEAFHFRGTERATVLFLLGAGWRF